MHNFDDLERRYLKRRNRLLLRRGLAGAGMTLAFALTWVLWGPTPSQPAAAPKEVPAAAPVPGPKKAEPIAAPAPKTAPAPRPAPEPKVEQKTPPIAAPVPVAELAQPAVRGEKPVVFLEGRMAFENRIGSSPAPAPAVRRKETAAPAPETPTEEVEVTREEGDVLALLKEKFAHRPTYRRGVEIGRRHYAAGEYEEALAWAVKANELDATREESWLLYARSQEKLGHRAKGVEALGLYLRSRESERVQRLYETMKKEMR